MQRSRGGRRFVGGAVAGLAFGAMLTGSVIGAGPAYAAASEVAGPTAGSSAWLDDAPPPAGTMGEAYSFTFVATGSPVPIVAVTAGALPRGLSMDSAGNVTGTPTQSGSFTFTVTADNGIGPRSMIQATIEVQWAPITNYTEIGVSSTSTSFRLWHRKGPYQDSVDGIELWCPPETPYLINQHLAPGRIVPHGVHVHIYNYMTGRVDNVGVSSWAVQKDGYQAGVTGLSATLWNGFGADGPTDVTITLHCTNNPADAKPW